MRKIVLTGYDDAMSSVGDLTAPLIADYAARHGFEYHCMRQFRGGVSPQWQTAEAVVACLASFDIVLWIGADVAVSESRFDPVPFLGPGLNVSLDWGPSASDDTFFSTGSYAATRESLPLWSLALKKIDVWGNCELWEQSALQEVCRERPEYLSLVHVFPRRFFNSVPVELQPNAVEPWRPGDWLCHMTSTPNDARVSFFMSVFRGPSS